MQISEGPRQPSNTIQWHSLAPIPKIQLDPLSCFSTKHPTLSNFQTFYHFELRLISPQLSYFNTSQWAIQNDISIIWKHLASLALSLWAKMKNGAQSPQFGEMSAIANTMWLQVRPTPNGTCAHKNKPITCNDKQHTLKAGFPLTNNHAKISQWICPPMLTNVQNPSMYPQLTWPSPILVPIESPYMTSH